MSSLFMLAATLACRGQAGQPVSAPPGQTRATSKDTMSTGQLGAVVPGIHPNIVFGTLRNPYAGDAGAREEGRRLFVAYNCSGCHGGRAGGGMGPSLRDSLWTYGGEDTQVYSTIVEGRPAGMPAWGAMLSQDQIWKLITYIRSLRTPDEPDQVSVK